ncbi:MAG: DeoR/GlpR family DNA-binding transcription regulator [Acidimicrobiia bacterium]|nr:DeoR/GlpR family DNA-binding transcription regulator [Acidimicrobiia bacterium]
MLPRQRQNYILDKIRQTGGVKVADLVRDLEVSDMTIRRDLDVLAQSGRVVKVHGGATAINQRAAHEPGFGAKSSLQRREKEAIAAAAAALVQPGTAIGLSAGTTTHILAQQLLEIPALTVVTNSVWVADALHEGGAPDQTVLLTGGRRTPSDALVGPFAVAALRTVHLDQVFMGVHGFDSKAGLTTPNMLEAETNRALVDAGRQLVVVADHTKWGAVGMNSITTLNRIDVLVIDDGLDPAARPIIEEDVGDIIIAEVPGRDASGWEAV